MPGLATVAELKAYLDITKGTEDTLLQALLDGAGVIVERYTGRSFNPAPPLVNVTTVTTDSSPGAVELIVDSVEDLDAGQLVAVGAGATQDVTTVQTVDSDTSTVTFATGLRHPHQDGETVASDSAPAAEVLITLYDGERIIKIPDARELTSVKLDDVTVAYRPYGDPATHIRLAQWAAVNGSGAVDGRALELTGRFGIWPVPADIKDAALVIAARRYRERDASYGDTVVTGDGAVLSYFRQLPPAVQLVLSSYRIPKVA